MTPDELFSEAITKAESFGFILKNKDGKADNPRGNAIVRKYITEDAFTKGGAFFGLIRPEQEVSGPYSDYSFVVFPDKNLKAAIVGLVIGSSGFENDYELSAQPGLRRQFIKLNTDTEKSFFKDDFQDKDSTFARLVKYVRQKYPDLAVSIESYKNVIVACEVVDFPEGETSVEESLKRIFAWLACYARIRENGSAKERKEQDEHIPSPVDDHNDEEIIERLLLKRKYVVLQGAPGTGKTFTALKIARKYDKVFFDQFHAETTYSDFIGGLQPAVESEAKKSFVKKDGVLTQAIKHAKDNKEAKVLLIIDEINRANLANVLGPVFYLFEPTAVSLRQQAQVKINVNGVELEELPPNIHLLATMNTADRSLAVVDFALRRRFGWYTMRPRILAKKELDGRKFDTKLFNAVNDIFVKYASDAELSLQPGHSYFIFDGDDDDENRKREKIEYELMPLIKEYLTEGYLSGARTEFSELFLSYGCRMYE